MSCEVVMELLSSKYGWTPDEIRQMSTIDVINYLEIISAKEKNKNKK